MFTVNGELNFEAFDADYAEFQELLNESVRETVQAENAQAATDELEQLADDVEMNFGRDEEAQELVENLRFVALQNPVSETAYDLRFQAMKYLR